MDDPELKRLVDWQARLQRMEARLDELARLFERYRALTRAIETGVPPPPPPSVN
jgi:hypothetical protein